MKTIGFLVILAAAVMIVGCEEDRVVDVYPDQIYYDGAIPEAPVAIWSVTHDGFIEIVWQTNNDAGLTTGYGVYRFVRVVDDMEEYELIATVDAQSGLATMRYNDHSAVNGVTYWYAVNAYNEWGESELSYESAFDTPRPQGTATLRDFHTFPDFAGYDFSAFQVVNWESSRADVFFEYDANLESFFFFAGNDLTDIQSYGYTDDITDVNWGDPGGGWSKVGWMELLPHHAYLVWTEDNHFAAFRVDALSPTHGQIEITWSYQTDPGNPELKRRPLERPEHAENYGRRER